MLQVVFLELERLVLVVEDLIGGARQGRRILWRSALVVTKVCQAQKWLSRVGF